MRVGVWNMEAGPRPDSRRGVRLRDLMATSDADVWLLTEIAADWALPGFDGAVSGVRSSGPVAQRWAGIFARDAQGLAACAVPEDSPGAEGLCLARLSVRSSTGEAMSALVACSVLPWSNTVRAWPSLHPSPGPRPLADRFQEVLDDHVARIRAELRPGDALLWGGDFNQTLSGRVVGTIAGRGMVADAFAGLGLTCPTANVAHLLPGLSAIDHLAVPAGWASGSMVGVVVHGDDPRQDSDHALYLIDLPAIPPAVTP